MLIRPAGRVVGTITVPGDKSISHRAAILTAMAEGESEISHYLTGEDCLATIRCLRQLGVEIEQYGTSVRVNGVGKSGFKKPNSPLDCGNSGTTMRLLAGVLAGQDFESTLTGDESLRGRPMNRIIEPLRLMGAEIDSNEGKAPLTIRGRNPLNAISYTLPVASAQVKSCVLLAGLNAKGVTRVIENVPTRDHTERMLRRLGADLKASVDADGNSIEVDGSSSLRAREICVPSDISSAAFFMVAAAGLVDARIRIRYVGINSTRAYILEKLRSLGVYVRLTPENDSYFEPATDIRVHGLGMLSLKGGTVSGNEVAQLIDEIPLLAVLGTRLPGGIEIHDAKELRIKETDRITAIVENLRRMKATVEEFDDGFRVEKSQLNGAEVDSFGDHRIAMAFAVAGLFADGDTIIKDPECADISFPGFYDLLESVVQR
jgi:3-phosphoshikimate 1-carboxyvinyltransferase